MERQPRGLDLTGVPDALRGALIWLDARWLDGAGFLAVGALALAPLIGLIGSAPLLLLFLHTPVFMLHQIEEHVGDRFRRELNAGFFGDLDVLTRRDVLAINMPLVWGLNLAALYAAVIWNPGCGLVAPYTMLINAGVHIGTALARRRANPGLLTSLVLFLPLSIATIVVIGSIETVDFPYHIVGFLLAAVLHLLIVLRLLYRLEALGGSRPH